MIVFESRLVRRFVGRLERGEEVIATLQQLCEHERIRSGWIHGAGILEWADLTEWDPSREAWRTPRRIEGPLTVLSVEGNVAIRNGPPWVQLHVMLAKQTGSSTIETVGGTLASARVYSIEFAIEGYEDVRLERDEDLQTGLSLFKGSSVRGVFAKASESVAARPPAAPRAVVREDREEEEQPSPRPAATAPTVATASPPSAMTGSPPPSAASGISWAQAAAASEEAAKRVVAAPPQRRVERQVVGHLPPPIPEKRERAVAPAFLDEPTPGKGDWIEHRQFGLCRVDGEDEDGGLKIRLPSGVRKVIKLDYFEVLPPRHEGDRKIFPLRPRKR